MSEADIAGQPKAFKSGRDKENWPAQAPANRYLWGLNRTRYRWLGPAKTPGGWGAENYRSPCRTEPSEATREGWSRMVAGEGPNFVKIVIFNRSAGFRREVRALPGLGNGAIMVEGSHRRCN